MVAVEVAQKDRVDTRGVESRALQREERRRAAVEEKHAAAGLDEIAAVVAPAAAESVAAAENRELHARPSVAKLILLFMTSKSRLFCVSVNTHPFFTRYSTSLWVRFLRFNLVSNKKLQDDLERLDLTPPQFYVLATIGYAGGLPFGEIGEKMMVTVSNLTGIVDRLEEKKLVVRERDARDRRVVRVMLTDKGLKVYRNTIPVFEKSISQFFSPLNKRQQKELAGLLRKLIRITSAA